MTKSTHYTRTSALPAIAAALALSSTPVLAQTQPVPTDTAPATTIPTPPAPDVAPTDTAPTPTTGPASDTVTATTDSSQTDTAPVSKHKSVVHAHKAVAQTSEAPARATARLASAHPTPTHPTVAKAAVPPVAPVASSSNQLAAASPVADVQAKQAQSSTHSTVRAHKHDNTVPIAAGGVLALLAIGGAAVAANRRRDEEGEEWLDDEASEREPVTSDVEESPSHLVQEEQPAILAPPVSAFAWHASDQSPAAATEGSLAEGDDRAPGETWVERAYRGPSPLNPSVSLKTRLKRAAFFDKRERDAAAGLAEPVEPTAGLPERMVDDNEEERQGTFA